MTSSCSTALLHKRRGSKGSVPFDRGHSQSPNPESRLGFSYGNGPALFGHFRNTSHDRLPPKEVVTGRLLGDPAPDRPRPAAPPIPENRIQTASGPVLLTFRELEASKKLTAGMSFDD